jgi:hypothetical protein
MTSSRDYVFKEAAWVLSNLCGSAFGVEMVVVADLLPVLCSAFASPDRSYDTKKEVRAGVLFV